MALTSVVLSSRPANGTDGAKEVTALLLPDANMPANGWPVTPALFGLTRFKPAANGTQLLPPKLVGSAMPPTILAMINSLLNLQLGYPTGGVTTAPTTPANPFVTAGATPVTSTAATGTLTPGQGKLLPTAGDGTNWTILATAIGYV